MGCMKSGPRRMGTFGEKSLDLPGGNPEQGALRTVGGRAPGLLEPAAHMPQSALKRSLPPPTALRGCARQMARMLRSAGRLRPDCPRCFRLTRREASYNLYK